MEYSREPVQRRLAGEDEYVGHILIASYSLGSCWSKEFAIKHKEDGKSVFSGHLERFEVMN